MFKSNQYCSRYEEIPIQLDTPLITPSNGSNQKKVDIYLHSPIGVHTLIGLMDFLRLNLLLIN